MSENRDECADIREEGGLTFNKMRCNIFQSHRVELSDLSAHTETVSHILTCL